MKYREALILSHMYHLIKLNDSFEVPFSILFETILIYVNCLSSHSLTEASYNNPKKGSLFFAKTKIPHLIKEELSDVLQKEPDSMVS